MLLFRPSRLRSSLGTALLLLAVFAAGNVTGYVAKPATAAESPTEFAPFWEAWDLVLNHFVDRDAIDYTSMTYGAIGGMLSTLGDNNHTVFFTPEEAEQQQSSLEGSFEGIGAYVDSTDGVFTITASIHGSPAERSGLLAGDRVLKVDGEVISGQPQWQVISKIRGDSGTSVRLTVLHADASEPVDIEIVRGRIDIDSILWAPIPETNLVYLQVTQFAVDTDRELSLALEAIFSQARMDGGVDGIVLDLRNNPGGYFNEALRLGGQFLENGAVIVHERDADAKISTHIARGSGLARDIPLVVLVNEGSASAAEIIAGAIQENGRAKLIGEPTLGTGTVLRPFTLSDGSVVRLGVTHWLTPDYNLLKDEGVQPDVLIAQEASVEMVDAFALEEMTKEELYAHPDRQFASALTLLRLATMGEDGGTQALQTGR